jgi:hypothetical protein
MRIHCAATGRGPWITLAHALATDSSIWDGAAAALARRFTARAELLKSGYGCTTGWLRAHRPSPISDRP